MAEVTLEQIGKTYPGGVEAVRGVNLRVADGELVVLVGPSGSGKTTLLRLIAGLETPTTGVLRIGDHVVNDVPPHRRDVAMVFQRPALYPHLSVWANLGFSLKLRRGVFWRRWLGRRRQKEDEKAEERILAVAGQLGLENVLERRPATLSGGQQQRVALGRALVRRPAVFLLDEPLSNLDARLRLDMRRELHLLHRRLRATMIYVTHDQDEAMALGERVVVLDQGVIRQADHPQALYDQPADPFVAGFLGWPPMNLLVGELIAVGDRLTFANWDVCLVVSGRPDWQRLVGRPLLLGIRPEDVAVTEGPGEGRLGMEVRLIERLGPIRLVTLAAASWVVTVRTPPTPEVNEGETVYAAFDLARAHLFDPATGRALCHGHEKLMIDD
ncbi:MAG TPA: ABC transporter ATP-binding protein [Gemmataceae bacterium]|jgi:multiple sugar transport system ATP-binding protein